MSASAQQHLDEHLGSSELPEGSHRESLNTDTATNETPALTKSDDSAPIAHTDAAVGSSVKPGDYVDEEVDPDAKHDVVGHPDEKASVDKPLVDLGWHQKKGSIDSPLIAPLDNETLWMLQRRFGKQIVHVKCCPAPPGGLDLNISDDEEFSPDKLRAHFERIYMSLIISGFSFAKQAARLSSWNEARRTACFATVYAAAWAFDVVVPTLLALLFVLIVIPQSRNFLFPPIPMALVSAKTGELKQPTAGSLGSSDSITGATEAHRGEAAEAEAANLTASVAHIALSAAMGSHHPAAEGKEDGENKVAPDPAKYATAAPEVTAKISGGQTEATHEKVKQPMSAAIWAQARPFMRVLADLADGTERLANALSPTPPFGIGPRMRLGVIIGAASLVSYFVSAHMVVRGAEAGFGLAFFGQPLIIRGAKSLNQRFPQWPKALELRRSLFKGVPTDAQLTLTLLRVGEANHSPIPPPPSTNRVPDEHRPHETEATAGDTAETLGVSKREVKDVAHPADADEIGHIDEQGVTHGKKAEPLTKKKVAYGILGLAQSTTRGVVAGVLGSNRVKATPGSETAKRRLGILNRSPTLSDGPSTYTARFKGTKGYCTLITSASSPCLTFSKPSKLKGKDLADGTDADSEPIFAVGLSEITEIKKIGGLGWKSALIVGWALNTEIADALEIKDSSNTYHLTAITRRDELFNRLLALGGSAWESM